MTRPGTVRDCALRLIELLEKVGDDVLAKQKELAEAIGDLLALPVTLTVSGRLQPSDHFDPARGNIQQFECALGDSYARGAFYLAPSTRLLVPNTNGAVQGVHFVLESVSV